MINSEGLHNFEVTNNINLAEYSAYRYSLVTNLNNTHISNAPQHMVDDLRKIVVTSLFDTISTEYSNSLKVSTLGEDNDIYKLDLCYLSTPELTPSIFISLSSQIILINNAIKISSKEIKLIEGKLNNLNAPHSIFSLSINAILDEDKFMKKMLDCNYIKSIDLILQSPNFLNFKTKLKDLHNTLNNDCTIITYENRFGIMKVSKDFINLIREDFDYIKTGAGKIIINTINKKIDSNDSPVKASISEKNNASEVKEAFLKVDNTKGSNEVESTT